MLADRRHAHLLNYMYKRSLKAEYHVVRPRNTRLFEGTVLQTVRPKKQCVEKSVYVKGTRAWNSLSVTVRNIPNYNAFKTFKYSGQDPQRLTCKKVPSPSSIREMSTLKLFQWLLPESPLNSRLRI